MLKTVVMSSIGILQKASATPHSGVDAVEVIYSAEKTKDGYPVQATIKVHMCDNPVVPEYPKVLMGNFLGEPIEIVVNSREQESNFIQVYRADFMTAPTKEFSEDKFSAEDNQP
jgi:hypothetical protein